MSKIKLTKESFEEILQAAVEAFGYPYVLDEIKNINAELNFDDDKFVDEDSELYWNEEDDD